MADIVEYKDGKPGVRFSLAKPQMNIGRGSANDIVINDELISKAHAVIEKAKVSDDSEFYRYTIRDLGSTNGTYVNDEKIEQASLWDGDLIRIGMSFFRFTDENASEQDFSRTTELHKSWIPGLYYTKKKDD
jgi:pSer/pThr/pTyr-binding forkhead associated (FHA) protein